MNYVLEETNNKYLVICFYLDDLCINIQPGLKYEIFGLVRKDLIGEQMALAIEV